MQIHAVPNAPVELPEKSTGQLPCISSVEVSDSFYSYYFDSEHISCCCGALQT